MSIKMSTADAAAALGELLPPRSAYITLLRATCYEEGVLEPEKANDGGRAPLLWGAEDIYEAKLFFTVHRRLGVEWGQAGKVLQFWRAAGAPRSGRVLMLGPGGADPRLLETKEAMDALAHADGGATLMVNLAALPAAG